MPSFDTQFDNKFSTLEQYFHIDENIIVEQLLSVADHQTISLNQVDQWTVELVKHIRSEAKGKIGVENMMHEYALTEPEGVLLMCTAEALLRVPDSHTADALIADKLARGEWEDYVGKSEAWLMNASAWGLLMTGRILKLGRRDVEKAKLGLGSAIRRTGEPLIRSAVKIAMQVMGKQFVLGETLAEALKKSAKWEKQGYQYSYDMLGEGARTQRDADHYYQLYYDAIEAVGNNNANGKPEHTAGVSIKLSALHPRYQFSQRDRVFGELQQRVNTLAQLACKHNINLTIDAEEADRLEISLQMLELLMADPSLAEWQGLGLAVQAYQRRAPIVIGWLAERAEHYQRRLMVRLVKGAYWDTEIKISQTAGHHDFPVYTRKQATDLSYRVCAGKLLDARQWLYPQFATHNAYTVATILALTEDHSGFEFQRLHGMGESLYEGLKEQNIYTGPTRIYAPVGEHESLLAYLVRRLLENGANTSFVNKIIDPRFAPEDLLQDPVEFMRNVDSIPHPKIRAPMSLYSDRQVSMGLDLESPAAEQFFLDGLAQAEQRLPELAASLQHGDRDYPVLSPFNLKPLSQGIKLWDKPQVLTALARAEAAQPSWQAKGVEQRAVIAERFAELLQQHKAELMGLCCLEAGKGATDTDAEIREAIDFCRYYALHARRSIGNQQALGTLFCVSPWNFPLAIFVGQVIAGLVTGNTVLAKPSEQTILIAARAVELLHQAGVDHDAVILLPTDGPTAGDSLLSEPAIKGVMFTGSTNTAQHIYQQLATRGGELPVLIAETGGQNALIVDSTALPEQVVDDVISSGFQSAGQRCSALRVLFVQEDIADKLSEMIVGAMKEMRIGLPTNPSTDVGPVIDHKALERLEQHAEYMQQGHGKLIYRHEVPSECDAGYYFPPSLYEIDNINALREEVFGPVVHLVRFKAGTLDRVVADINSTGFGLTMGIHSRVQRHVDQVVAASNAGNIYVNRNIIGAVVGVQPFGGCGLSGTGPKAGGPDYLKRLLSYTAIEQAETTPYQSGVSADFNTLRQRQQAWQLSGFEERLSLIRHNLGERFARGCAEFAAQLCGPRMLEGPTGEDNSLNIEPRGLVWFDPSIAMDMEQLSQLVALAIVSGNAVVSTSQMIEQLPHSGSLIAAGVLAVHDISDATCHQQFICSNSVDVLVLPAAAEQLLVATTQQQGPLPVILNQQETQAAMLRFVHEKTLSNNISAAGGNAKLMAEMD
ncbi:L-proline dehydrogenase /delta-1-pyrroline-5-carboxylate dehydrogenase [Sinobacterium caligoides]|uniref:Bifunctional protein PutA n=1 Tax=Sinobacterium caligoides TaxID=933926 RepID=A0A3N2E030_9GAMM|nr:bifunctional proline dehydrogenase/L-glutamate gamma-semialdehyde dehydrogenase PutA [Sinobacterium caligoides]ROS05463.1 L-proline dehydrogenase /delta-1-pyrroline-5-carboxylate dehydrogenase [Sinobacterium caligoides]